MVMLMVIAPLHMYHHGGNAQDVTLVQTAHTLGMFGLSPFTGWLIDRFGRLRMVLTGGILLAAASLLAPVSTQNATLSAALFLIGLGWNFTFVAGSALFADHSSGELRARAQGIGEMASSGASAAGSLATGFIFAAGDFQSVAFCGVALSVLLMAAVAFVGLRSRAGGAPPLAGRDPQAAGATA
jgi:MFS family permease